MTAGVCTSSSRPTNPYIGDQIFETDTGMVLYWYGAANGWLPNWGVGGRLLGDAANNVTVQSSTFAVMIALTVSVAPGLVRGRKLLWIASFHATKQAGGAGTYYLADPATNQLCTRNLNNGLSNILDWPVVLAYKESIDFNQQVNVAKTLNVVGNNASIVGGPTKFYSLMCFDDGPSGPIPIRN